MRTLHVALLVSVLVLACKESKRDETSPTSAPKPVASAPTPTPTPAPTPPPPPTSFAWTEAPALDMIPAGPIHGEANGKPFTVQSVYLEPSFGKWELVLAEKKLDSPTDMIGLTRAVHVEVDKPAAGQKYAHEMSYGGGFFQVQKGDKLDDTTSWNAENAWVLEITKWDVKPYDKNGDMFQQAGTASGRIAVCYKGYGDFKNSYVAGTFEDAVVRYMGEPDFAKPDAGKAK